MKDEITVSEQDSLKVKQVDIVFENCDFVAIPAEFIEYFYLKGISDNLRFDAFSKTVSPSKSISEVFLVLNQSADSLKTKFMDDSDNDIKDEFLRNAYTNGLFNFINIYQDITALDVIYEDESHDYLYVAWPLGSEYTNYHQLNELTDSAGLAITISEDINNVKE